MPAGLEVAPLLEISRTARERHPLRASNALLLATILRDLGIEADPVLVNTRRGRLLDSSLPTPYAFDHAIVRMRLANETYWLDGTHPKQFSPVTANAVGDFSKALVLDSAAGGLVSMPRPGTATNSKQSEVLVDLRAGVNKPAKLQISTFYEGRLADSQRQDLADQSSTERLSSYLKYIVGYYPNAKVAAPITFHDDQARNRVEVREYYTIDPPFDKNDHGHPELFLQADEIYRYINELKGSTRKAPLAIQYPVRVQQSIHVLLPWKLKIKTDSIKIDNPAFRYQDDVTYSEEGGVPQMTVDYRYESLSDFVDVASLPKYADDRRRAYDDTGYYIRPGTEPHTVTFVQAGAVGPLAPGPRWVALVSWFIACTLGLRFFFRWDPPAAKTEPDYPVGIRGWLLFMAVITFLAPLMTIYSLRGATRYIEVNRWQHLHDVAPEPLQLWAPAVLLVLTAVGVFLLVAEILLIPLFIRKRTSAPRAFIAILWSGVLYSAAMLLFAIAAHLDAPVTAASLTTQLGGGVIEAAIYTAYFLLSKRVKATFVVRRAHRQEKPAVAPVAVAPQG